MTHVQTLSGAAGHRTGVSRGLRRRYQRLRLSLAAGVDTASPVTVAVVATAILSAYFVMLPGVDLAVTRLVFDPVGGFTAASDPVLRALRKSSSGVMGLILLGLIVVAVRGWWTGWQDAKKAPILISGLALASGVLVNGLFKASWGRARPIQIEAFGGEAEFWRSGPWRRSCFWRGMRRRIASGGRASPMSRSWDGPRCRVQRRGGPRRRAPA